MELLTKLLDVISEMATAWDIFSSPNGDISYFSDLDFSLGISPPPTGPAKLRAIKETFEMLDGLRRKLLLLDQSCQNSAQAVSLDSSSSI